MNQTTLKLNTIKVVLLDHMLVTSVSLPMEMLEAASNYQKLAKKNHHLKMELCSQTLSEISCHGQLKLKAEKKIHPSDTDYANLILIPALWRNPLPTIKNYKNTIEWIKNQHSKGAYLCAAGTGVTLLAEAGLLQHQPATTHWYFMNKLRHQYPNILFKPHHFITQAGNIFCAGSVNSVADLIVYIIKISMGSKIAYQVSQQFSHEIRRSFEQTHFAKDHTTNHDDETIVSLQEWLHNNYQLCITSKTLQQVTGLSQRSLNRRFKKATDITPNQYLLQIRMNQSTDLLKNSNLSITEISDQVGFDDRDYFSRKFKYFFQITPSSYRQSVHNKLFHL